MGIKDKQTYGEYYWAMQVEAQKFFDEDVETAFAPMFAGVLKDLPDISEFPEGIRNFLGTLAEPPSAGFGGFALGVGVEMIDETLHSLMSPVMNMMSRSINRKALETWLKSSQGNTLFRRGKIQEDFWKLITSSEGYDDLNARFLYQSEAAYPTIPDLILYSRYHGPPDNVWSTLQDFYDVDAGDFKLWNWLALQRLTTEQSHTLLRRGGFREQDYRNEMSRIGWADKDILRLQETSWLIPNAMLMTQGNLLQQKSRETILSDISIADINPKYSQLYLDAVLTKPSTQDVINYQLREDPSLGGLDNELKRIGIHDNYFGLYKTLANPIPPVSDLITMAVREAFTPDIARKFGQYEDFPPEFEKWAAKKGLTKDWAERYWAAHWALPSVSQGFEMLHRGIITDDELSMLLRALDVMPFWRDRLIKMSYRLLTRVDVRRMYRVGVLTETEVYEAYLDAGYDEKNAERMAEFTVKQTLSVQAKFSSTDVVRAFTQFIIDRSEANSLLKELGISSTDAVYILNLAEHKREWEITELKIAAIRNKYKKYEYDENKTRGELLKLDLPSRQVDALMDKWWFEPKEVEPPTWTTAQTIKFAKTGLISKARAQQELKTIGYDAEHINVYMMGVE